METKISYVKTNSLLTKSNLPASDYVINPYVGCLHGCKYCYACFMKRFTNHHEEWGKFIDVKKCSNPIDTNKLEGKSVFISSVTDCYNPIEETEKLTQKILKQLINANCEITITTKSSLVLRDIEIIKQLKNAMVAISINTLDESFKNDMDNASSIADRINTLKVLHDNGIKTILFMSPIFPEITSFAQIIEATKKFVDVYWFENLNLRGSYRATILNYIKKHYPNLITLYNDIYVKNDKSYWKELAIKIDDYCFNNKIKFKNYFYHEQIRKNTKNKLTKS